VWLALFDLVRVHEFVAIRSYLSSSGSMMSKVGSVFAGSSLRTCTSAIAGLRDVIRSQAIVVIGGVDVVSRPWFILCLHCAPCLYRGRSQ
jgi:hypothetical protein